jgi:hypothetical protein
MATNVVGGIEQIEVAPAFQTEAGIASAVWTVLENIAPDTVLYTKNADTESSIVPEDKDVAFITFYTPGEPDSLAVGLLEQKPEVMQLLENVVYAPATTKVTTLAKRKIADLAWRITTRPMKDGRKCIIIIPNTHAVTTYANNLSKTTVQQLLITAKIDSFKTTTGSLDAISIKTWVLADGTAIDSED